MLRKRTRERPPKNEKKLVKVGISSRDPNVLNLIAEQIENGADPADFDEIIDAALGTAIPKDDLEKNILWEEEFGRKNV